MFSSLFSFEVVLPACCCCFFSSRRRHTRLQGDWSSDVCSSDLYSRASSMPPCISICIAYPSCSRSEEHTSELQSPCNLVCRLLLEKTGSERDAATLREQWGRHRGVHRSRTRFRAVEREELWGMRGWASEEALYVLAYFF